MKPTAIIIPNSVNTQDTETINEPMLVVVDADTKEFIWGVDLIAKTFEDLEAMEKYKIVYTSSIEQGTTEKRNGVLLYGTTYENVIWSDDELLDKEKTRSAATERAI